MNYKGYTYKELLQDDFFLESQLTPTDDSIRFWDTIIKNDEALASEINRTQEIICRIPFRKKEISADAQDELLNRINQSIDGSLYRQQQVLHYSVYWVGPTTVIFTQMII